MLGKTEQTNFVSNNDALMLSEHICRMKIDIIFFFCSQKKSQYTQKQMSFATISKRNKLNMQEISSMTEFFYALFDFQSQIF